MTGGQVLACSPVVIVDGDGRRFELVGREVTCKKAPDKGGEMRATAPPVLTLVIREVKPATPPAEGKASE